MQKALLLFLLGLAMATPGGATGKLQIYLRLKLHLKFIHFIDSCSAYHTSTAIAAQHHLPEGEL